MICSDPVLEEKVKKCEYEIVNHNELHNGKNILLFPFFAASEKISENLHIVANDPSLAFYRIQEHIRKGLCVQSFILPNSMR